MTPDNHASGDKPPGGGDTEFYSLLDKEIQSSSMIT
jgi:hypothetical protein